MNQVAIKPLHEGRVRPQDFAWFENEYGYWFGYASHPARELAKRSGTWRTSTRRAPKQTARLAEPDDS